MTAADWMCRDSELRVVMSRSRPNRGGFFFAFFPSVEVLLGERGVNLAEPWGADSIEMKQASRPARGAARFEIL